MEVERSVRIRLRAAPSLLGHFGLDSIQDTPSITVPSAIGRKGLTEVVKHFLSANSLAHVVEAIPPVLEYVDFDRGVLLKASLERHLQKYHITEEDGVNIEYALPRASDFSAEGSGTPMPDWISSITSLANFVVSATFNGSLVVSRYVRGKGLVVNCECSQAHSSDKGVQLAVTSVSAFQTRSQRNFVASACKDGSVNVREISPQGQLSSMVVASCLSGGGGQTSHSLQSVASALSGDNELEVLLAAAGWAREVYLFQTPLSSEGTWEQESTQEKKKKAKLATTLSKQPPTSVLSGHTDAITAVVWSTKVDPVTVMSASYDGSARVWDCLRGVQVSQFVCAKAFLCLDYSASAQLLVSGHADHVVRMWDTRMGGDAVVKLSLKGHHGWVSSVCFDPQEGSTQIASASYDHTARIWDWRGGSGSSSLVRTLNTEASGRLFAVEWSEDHETLFVGGADSVLRTYAVSSTA